jgi:DNA-binding winged helix-turn-helix (wHTH) protein
MNDVSQPLKTDAVPVRDFYEITETLSRVGMRCAPRHGEPVIRFGRFHLDRARRRLELDGVRVRIGDRALDILIALAARPGEVVLHNELLDRVWPGTVADGSNLRFHITALRKALGDPALIRNVHGRGYCLATEEAAPPVPPASGRAGRLPPEPARMVRRAEAVEEITRLLAAFQSYEFTA